jgi:hypothetical protein
MVVIVGLGGVPKGQRTAVLVLPEHAQSRDVQEKPGGDLDIDLHPGDRHRPQDVAVGEGEHAAGASRRQRDEVHRSRVDLGRRFAARASVSVKLPAWSRFVDRFCSETFVFAVIDLAKKRGQLGVGKPRDLGRPPCALERARVNGVELEAG